MGYKSNTSNQKTSRLGQLTLQSNPYPPRRRGTASAGLNIKQPATYEMPGNVHRTFRKSKIFSYSKKMYLRHKVIRDFIDKNPQAKDTMNNWHRTAEKADWSNFHEIKSMFSNSVDAIGNDRFVFNVGGGNYRIIAMIFF